MKGAVVITGASTGIGKACALYLDKIGFRVFAGVRKKADGERLIQESSGRLMPLFIDVTDAASIEQAVVMVTKEIGDAGLSGLVNNAGIALAGALEFLPIDEIRKQFEVNVIGHIAVIQAFLPLLRKAKGRIVNMGSINGRIVTPFIGPYCATKFALEALTDSLRAELLPFGVDVVVIEPGDISTPIWDKSISASLKITESYPPEALELYRKPFDAIPKAARRAARVGFSPDVVARAVARALIARRPRTRYLVGWDARLQLLMRKLLPDRALDWIIMQFIGLPGRRR